MKQNPLKVNTHSHSAYLQMSHLFATVLCPEPHENSLYILHILFKKIIFNIIFPSSPYHRGSSFKYVHACLLPLGRLVE
jgi:hypothetical protein